MPCVPCWLKVEILIVCSEKKFALEPLNRGQFSLDTGRPEKMPTLRAPASGPPEREYP
ncbi:hypothetical protein GGE09_004012 [Roseobacter sp. N2S]|nr:hypothetical protein [Roseobacter sp. N2S]